MYRVNRCTTLFVDLDFEDQDGDPVIPTAATAKIHDRDTDTVIRAAGAITGLSSSITIALSDNENEIITTSRDREVHVLTIEFDYVSILGDAHGTAEKEFMVENLEGVEASPSP